MSFLCKCDAEGCKNVKYCIWELDEELGYYPVPPENFTVLDDEDNENESCPMHLCPACAINLGYVKPEERKNDGSEQTKGTTEQTKGTTEQTTDNAT
jgi:hypothetical protein